MLPTSLSSIYSTGLQGYQPTMGAATLPASQFAATGIPSLDGSAYAYAPGSEMTSFLDNLNNSVGAATKGPDGVTSVMDWANGLAQQAALRKQQQALIAQQMQALTGATGGSATGGASNPLQMLQMMFSMLLTQMQGQSVSN